MRNDSINLTCEKVNSLLKRNNFNIEIKPEEITKTDDDFIKARRNDLISTMTYDISKINEIIKNLLDDYELIGVQIFHKDRFVEYPTYLCIVKRSEYNIFFGANSNETEGSMDTSTCQVLTK